MKYYQVNNIQFSFRRQFDEFLVDNIEKYEIDPCDVNHHIETILVDEITMPKQSPTVEINGRNIYICEEDETIVIFKDDTPVILIEKAHDYKTMFLYMKKGLEGSAEIEYVYTGIMFMDLCLYHQMQSIHGSAIIYQDQVIIFSGPSGVGKSTHVNYWKEKFDSIEIINDDKPLLSINRGRVYVSGSPWSGKTKINANKSLPLHSIVFLEQGDKDEVTEIDLKDKLIPIMRNINRPRQDELWDKTKNILLELINTIPMYKALVTNNINAAKVVKDKIGV